MVKYFKEVLGNDGKVYVCNSDDKSIAFKYADEKVISPLIYDENYIPFLLDYCRKNEIDIVISLFDIDLLMLARHKKEFEKIGTNFSYPGGYCQTAVSVRSRDCRSMQ